MKKSFKRFAAILLGLALLAASATAAFAVDEDEDKSVTFTGDKLASSYEDAKVAQELFTMQPGEERVIDVDLYNNVDRSATWYISNRVIKSLEEQAANDPSNGAYTYKLVFNPDKSDELTLFESVRVGGEEGGTSARARAAADDVGLKEINENLEGYQFLSTLPARGHAVVQLTVELDGETQGNAYQNTLANLQLSFAVDPDTSIDRTQTVVNRVNREVTTVVQTGEGSDRLPFVLATGISGLLFLLLGLVGMVDGRKAKKAAQKALCLALALTLACAAPAMLGNVARADDGTYTLRVFAGKRGTVAEGIVSVENGKILSTAETAGGWKYTITKGAQVTLNLTAPNVTVTDSKYYVQGVRLGGVDNNDRLGTPTFTLNEDADYVIAYGVKGVMVDYEVRYVDTAGNTLRESQTFSGKVGDRPVVPYQPIAGYLPQAYNLTRELVTADEVALDPTKNVFTFTYTPIPENITTEQLTELLGGGVVVIPGAAPGAPVAPAGPGGVVLPEEETPLAPPEEIIDLDNPETPQAGPGESSGGLEDLIDNATPLSGLPMAAKVGIGVAAAAVLGGAAFLIVKKRKKNNAEAS